MYKYTLKKDYAPLPIMCAHDLQVMFGDVHSSQQTKKFVFKLCSHRHTHTYTFMKVTEEFSHLPVNVHIHLHVHMHI